MGDTSRRLSYGMACLLVTALSRPSFAAVDQACAAPAKSPPTTLLPPNTHIAVFNLTKRETGWRALFFSGESVAARQILLTLSTARAAETDKAVEAAWAAYATAVAGATKNREEEVASATLQRDARSAFAKRSYEKAMADATAPSELDDIVKAYDEQLTAAKDAHAAALKAALGREKEDKAAAEKALIPKDEAQVAAAGEGEPVHNETRMSGAMQCVDGSKDEAEPRFRGSKGDQVLAFTFYGGDRSVRPSLEGKEVARSSRIEQDLATLGQLLLSGALPLALARGAETPKTMREVFLAQDAYVLTKKRATLTLALSPPEPKPAPRAPEKDGFGQIADSIGKVAAALAAKEADAKPRAAAADAKGGAITATIATGRPEHLFLSANVNVKKFADVKYDDASKTLVPVASPARFLLGVNYFFGDLASEKSSSLFVSLLIEPSKKPTSSVGVGVGLRVRAMKSFLGELDGFSPYAGYLRVSAEAEPGQPSPRSEWRWVFGVTLNLDKVAGWLKK